MENTDKMVIDTLKEVGALLEGHFLLSSGKHSDRYCQCAKLLQYPDKAAKVLKVAGYCRIDAFVRIYSAEKVEIIFIEVNSLPGMTPATCIFHQSAINHYKPYEFIDRILDFGFARQKAKN